LSHLVGHRSILLFLGSAKLLAVQSRELSVT
jgi:hypothetical protein